MASLWWVHLLTLTWMRWVASAAALPLQNPRAPLYNTTMLKTKRKVETLLPRHREAQAANQSNDQQLSAKLDRTQDRTRFLEDNRKAMENEAETMEEGKWKAEGKSAPLHNWGTSMHNSSMLLDRLLQAGAAPPTLLRLVEGHIARMADVKGLPGCTQVARYWAKPQTNISSLCITQDVLAYRSSRVLSVPFEPLQLNPQIASAMNHRHAGMQYPLIATNAWPIAGDFRCSVPGSKKKKHLDLGCKLPRNMKNRSLLFVATFSLKRLLLVLNTLPHFFLISHWTDLPISDTISDHRKLLASPKVLLWFANSLETVHPKLRPLPLGLHEDRMRMLKRSITQNPTSSVPHGLLLAKFRIPGEAKPQTKENFLYNRYCKRRAEAVKVFKAFPNLNRTRTSPARYFPDILEHRLLPHPIVPAGCTTHIGRPCCLRCKGKRALGVDGTA